ncbi:hypothetical protein ABE485_24345 [Achromobacter spanius]|uniref:hypothetical protein n=1 Tax=Achromobacter spanius TaxID=217203 RepID=UPI003208D511
MVWPVLQVVIPETLGTAFVVVRGAFEECGLKIENPDNSKVSTWGVDGDQKNVAAGDLSSEVEGGKITNIQFWRTAGDDVFVAWKKEVRGCVFSIYLDGVDRNVATRIVSKFTEIVLVKYRLKLANGEALAIVFE